MIRFIFTLIFGYIILKIIKLFIDPLLKPSPTVQSAPKVTANTQQQKQKVNDAVLGEYVEYEEIK